MISVQNRPLPATYHGSLTQGANSRAAAAARSGASLGRCRT